MQKDVYRILFILFLLAFCGGASAQMEDDFSDGDFTQNPKWIGDESLFIVNSNFQLQLNDTDERTASLATEQRLIANTEWRFWIRMSFSPSNNNYAQVYLAADNWNLKEPLNGYFLRFGEAGNNDAIELYRQEGTTKKLICRGPNGAIANSFTARVKVICDADNRWTLFADMSGGTAFQEIASDEDVPFFESKYLGVFCQYTRSNSTNFYFDDFYAGAIIIDNEPPELQQVTALSPNSLRVVFNEVVTGGSAQAVKNYSIAPNHVDVAEAVLQPDGRTVNLTLSGDLVPRTQYLLTAQNISDVSGNVADKLQGAFSWNVPLPNDILINEIMVRPSPTVGLPNASYVELFNNTDFNINLNGWSLVMGNSTKNFGDYNLPAQQYLILCHNNDMELLAAYGACYGFSSFSLTNGGMALTLYAPEKEQIAYVRYSDTWYGDAMKKDGGWSLERIDPTNGCDQSHNWTASKATAGGTPGARNSVFSDHPEVTEPELLRAEYVDETTITAYFNKTMNPASISDVALWSADYGMGNPITVTPEAPDFTTATLVFNKKMDAGEVYTLTLKAKNVVDCGNVLMWRDGEARFGKPTQPEKFEIIINEVLFQPTGLQYVELYNRSSYIFDTKYLRFTYTDNKGVSRSCAIPSFLLFPNDYAVLTKRKDDVINSYRSNIYAFVETDGMPTLSTSIGTVQIGMAADTSVVIDAMRYDTKMHSAMINTVSGVSLERISPNRPSGEETNWHSAAETAGFGTPGYKNSQFDDGKADDEISIDPEVFTPNNDGIDDYLNIRYKFNEAGYVANVYIYSSSGKFVRRLANNVTIGTEGAFSWDGKDENNQLSNAGIYVIVVEIFNLQGKTKQYKKTGTLGVRF
ncbi:MAG: lamin tail domain-containing protein [Bacteroidales bacterium]|nr:lamin tail domain-containing protein [Bacteroidales bacterium]